MRIESAKIGELGATEIARWRCLQRSDPSLANPHFSPDYAQIMADARPDARVAIVEDSNGIQGFFAVQMQHRYSSAAMPLGAPVGDYQGLVGAATVDVSVAALCKALRVGRLDFARALAHQRTFAAHSMGHEETWIADVSAGSGAYFAGVKERRPQFAYQLGRTHRKLCREHGDVVFEANARDPRHLATLLQWKEQQLARSRQPLVWRTKWVRESLEASMARANDHFGGVMFTLSAGDRLIAGNLCFVGAGGLHGVLMAQDAAYDSFSPGLQLLRNVIDWAAVRGLREVDFGTGEQLFKRQFGTHRRAVVSGWAGPPSLASWSRSSQYALRKQIERIPNKWIAGLPGRAMRRMDVYSGLSAPRA